jgi:hypothetical protein
MLDIGRSFAFPFRDPAWLPRALVGGLLEVLPVLVAVPFFVRLILRDGHTRPTDLSLLILPAFFALACRWVQIGYLRRVAQGTLAHTLAGLPPWDRFEDDLVEGFKLWLAAVGIFLPAIGVAGGFAIVVAALGATTFAWLPLVLVLPPLALATLFYLPAGLLAAIEAQEIGAAFDLTRVTARIGQCLGQYLLAFVVTGAALVVAQLGLIALCVGIFVTGFLARCVATHAFASAYCQGEPSPPAFPAS